MIIVMIYKKKNSTHHEGALEDGCRLEHNQHHDPGVLPLAQLVEHPDEVDAREHVALAADAGAAAHRHLGGGVCCHYSYLFVGSNLKL